MTSKWNPDSPSWQQRKRPRRFLDIVLRNDRHGTEHRMLTRFYRPITIKQIKLCRKALCPTGCCEGTLRQHGPQDVVVVESFDLTGRVLVTVEPVPGPLG